MSEPLEIGLDLDKHFLPSWAQQSANAAAYAHYQGGDDSRRSGSDRDSGRGPGRGGFDRRGPRPPRAGGGPRDFGPPRGPRRDFGGPRRDRGPGGSSGTGASGLHWDQGGPRQGEGGPRRDFPPREILPEVEVILTPEASGVHSLARQIKLSGRAYPLFEVAGLVVQKPDRYDVVFKTVKGKDGVVAQRLFECSLDGSVWLTESDAAQHVLRTHFDTFYQTEKLPTDPPKGVWTLVAQFDEIILGPPNYHGYQEKLREIHAQRAPRLPFEVFKSKVRMVKDEAAVKQWSDSQSTRLEYTTLNVPEPKKLATLDEVTAHFNEVHKANVIREVDSWSLKRGQNAPRLPGPLNVLLRQTVERERRFPIRTATSLSQQFAAAGLQFFKRDKVVVHVAVARPHYLDIEATPVKDGIQKIVEFINAHARCTRRTLLDALAPAGPAAAAATATTAAPEAAPAAASTESAAPAPAPAPTGPTPEQAAIISDLHWLVHQGHVIEFANGQLETAKKPLPKPPPPPRPARPVPATARTAPTGTEPPPAASESAAPAEVAPVEVAPDSPVAGEVPVVEPPASESPTAAATEDQPPGV